MSKYEALHRGTERGGGVHGGGDSGNLFDCAYDMCTRANRATDVVLGGLFDGAAADANKQLHDPKHLADETWGAVKSGLAGKAIGLGLRACPPLAIGAVGYSLYSFGHDTAPILAKKIPELQNYWVKAYGENDTHKLALFKAKVGRDFGHTALELGVNGGMAVIGFGGGLKAGSFVKSRCDGIKKSSQVLKETSDQNPVKALYFDKVLSRKPVGAKKVDCESGTYLYKPDTSVTAHYADGSKFQRSPAGIPSLHHNGEVSREIPGVMRITDKRNGDRVYKYHNDGLVETHKPTGTVIKEFGNGVTETHRKNGFVYREHPIGGGADEILKKNARGILEPVKNTKLAS